MRKFESQLIVAALATLAACAADPSEDTQHNDLGIARLEISDTPTNKTIVGLDLHGRAVATYEIKLGEFEMSPVFNEGEAGLIVPGRRITAEVNGQRAYSESADYPPLRKFMPSGDIGTFVRMPEVAITLASWGITFRGNTAALLDGEVAFAADPPWVGNPGYTNKGVCKDINCGYIFGVAGTQQYIKNPTQKTIASTDPNGGCQPGKLACGICNQQNAGPTRAVALMTADPTLGDLDHESYMAQLCTNTANIINLGTFFEIKACRQVTSPLCTNGRYLTSCGCTNSANAACKPCDDFIDGAQGRPQYVAPFGTIDVGFGVSDPIVKRSPNGEDGDLGANPQDASDYIQFSYSDACYPSGNYCLDDEECCSGSCNLKELGWGKCN